MDFIQGLVLEKVPEILTRGHVTKAKIEEIANLSQNVVLLTRFDFCKVMRITIMVIMFATKIKKNRRILSHARIICSRLPLLGKSSINVGSRC